jgi:hypothetical protein
MLTCGVFFFYLFIYLFIYLLTNKYHFKTVGPFFFYLWFSRLGVFPLFIYLINFEPIIITFITFDRWLGGESLFATFVLEHGNSPNFA